MSQQSTDQQGSSAKDTLLDEAFQSNIASAAPGTALQVPRPGSASVRRGRRRKTSTSTGSPRSGLPRSGSSTGSGPPAYRVLKPAPPRLPAVRYDSSGPATRESASADSTHPQDPISIGVQFCPVLNVARTKVQSIEYHIQTRVLSVSQPLPGVLDGIQSLATALWEPDMSADMAKQIETTASKLLTTCTDYIKSHSDNASAFVSSYSASRASLRGLMLQIRNHSVKHEEEVVARINQDPRSLGVTAVNMLPTCFIASPNGSALSPASFWELGLSDDSLGINNDPPMRAIPQLLRSKADNLDKTLAEALHRQASGRSSGQSASMESRESEASLEER